MESPSAILNHNTAVRSKKRRKNHHVKMSNPKEIVKEIERTVREKTREKK